MNQTGEVTRYEPDDELPNVRACLDSGDEAADSCNLALDLMKIDTFST